MHAEKVEALESEAAALVQKHQAEVKVLQEENGQKTSEMEEFKKNHSK